MPNKFSANIKRQENTPKKAAKPPATMSEDNNSPTSTVNTRGPEQKRQLLQWTSPVRPYKKLNKEVFSTILAGAFLLGVILFFIDGAIPVIALASLVFLFYVMGTVPPGMTSHTITNWGMESEDKAWPWEFMTRYWIQGDDHNRMLVVELGTYWPRHLRFMLGDIEENKLHELLKRYLVEDRPKPNWLEKTSVWLEGKIRLSPEGK